MISLNLTGRLTREPELRRVPDPSGGRDLDVCQVRVAARTRRGETVYLDVTEWGASGRAAGERLQKGSLIAFTGELRFREQAGENGTRRYLSGVGHIEFLDNRTSDKPADSSPVAAGDVAVAERDDIPL